MPQDASGVDSADKPWGEWIKRRGEWMRAVYAARGVVHYEFRPVARRVRMRRKLGRVDNSEKKGDDLG